MRSKLCSFVLLSAALLAVRAPAQEYDGDQGEPGVFGYTSIDFDPDTNVVTAYSETDVYGEALYFYQAEVQLWSNGNYEVNLSPNPTDSSVSATISYQGAAGNTYQATGAHTVELTAKFLPAAEYEYDEDDDAFGFLSWPSYDIESPWVFPFTVLDSNDPPEIDVVTLGQTYDSAVTTIPASCGNGDQRNTIIQEYVTLATVYFPQCSEFTQTLSDPHFTFKELNTGNYSWAILRSYFISELDALNVLSPGFGVNSAYRNPAKQKAIDIANGQKYWNTGSRHMYGDAVDVATTQSNWTQYQGWGHQLSACVEPSSMSGYGHAHLDWRDQATLGPTFTGCPKYW